MNTGPYSLKYIESEWILPYLRVVAKNVTVFIPELHFSSSNGLVELSSINITADFLEVDSGGLGTGTTHNQHTLL